MRAKQMLATMSHEIRSPLSGVVSMSEILSTTKLDKEQRQLLDVMISSGDLVLQLINDILDLSKVESGTRFTLFFKLLLTFALTILCFSILACANRLPKTDILDFPFSTSFRSDEIGGYEIPTQRSCKACTPNCRSIFAKDLDIGRTCCR